jgi:hypothetical protein
MSMMAVSYQTFDSTKVGAPNRVGSERMLSQSDQPLPCRSQSSKKCLLNAK